MYRHASLRLACALCGVERPFAAMTLSPRGGSVCWTCDVGRQIVEHTANSARVRSHGGLWALAGWAVVITMIAFGAMVWALRFLCWLY
jgi:hypothetical protein